LNQGSLSAVSPLPIGLHPVFRLPAETGAATLELGSFDEGAPIPHDVEPCRAVCRVKRFRTDRRAIAHRRRD
jgi:hypothetical protein